MFPALRLPARIRLSSKPARTTDRQVTGKLNNP
nr:MAG TPA: hypothetical protein [Bacteriophage sp.]